MNDKECFQFFKQTHKNHAIHVARHETHLLVSDNCSMWSLPSSRDWQPFTPADDQTMSYEAGEASKVSGVHLPTMWEQYEAKPVVTTLQPVWDGIWVGMSITYGGRSPWGLKLTTPEQTYLLVSWDYLALLDPELPFHAYLHTSEYRFEMVEGYGSTLSNGYSPAPAIRVSEQVRITTAKNTRESIWRTRAYLMPLLNARGKRGPIFQEKDVA